MAKMNIIVGMLLVGLFGCSMSPPAALDNKTLGRVQQAFPDATELRDVPVPEEAPKGRHAGQIVVKEIRGPARALGFCVESTVAAKSGPFRIRVLVDRNLVVIRAQVVSYTWDRGRDIRKPNFTRQFEGKGPEAPIKIGKDIDAMTGATLSSRAMTAGVRESIALLENIL